MSVGRKKRGKRKYVTESVDQLIDRAKSINIVSNPGQLLFLNKTQVATKQHTKAISKMRRLRKGNTRDQISEPRYYLDRKKQLERDKKWLEDKGFKLAS